MVRWLVGLLALAACGRDGAAVRDGGVAGAEQRLDAPPAVMEDIHFVGRFDAAHQFAWPGSTIATRIWGTDVKLDLLDGGSNFYEITIDGVAQPPLDADAGRHTYTLANGLPAGEHDVVVARRTESFFGVSQVFGFPTATLVPTPRKTRFIEFIGDSITCGYGVLGANMSCAFSAVTEAETLAWANLAATELDADHASIAYSGIGMYRNSGGGLTDIMPERYGRTFAEDPDTQWSFSYTPDVIVINLGTNDFFAGDPGMPYVTNYIAFVQMLRTKFPAAKILLATSPMIGGASRAVLRGYLGQVATTMSDPDVSVVEIAEQLDEDGLGCDYHPSVTTNHKMTVAIVAAIRAATGW